MNKNGFTFVEVLIAVILVALAVAALVGANRAYTQSNMTGIEISTAEFLIEQIKGLTTLLPVIDPETGTDNFGAEEASLSLYDDVDDFANIVFSPPINSQRQTLTDFSAYSQHVTVQKISPTNFSTIVTGTDYSFIRVTVEVRYNNEIVNSTDWIRARY